MNTKDVDLLNVILIIISLTLAFNIPFELFIFSYAILGPLHYLTEINWLNERNYFTQQAKWMWLFLIFAVIISIPLLFMLPFFNNLMGLVNSKKIGTVIYSYTDEMILTSILFSIGLIYFKDLKKLLLFLIASTTIALLILNFVPTAAIATTIFVPTVIHVYFFTLLFMIYGTINTKNTAGIIAIMLLILAPIIIMISKINPIEYYAIPELVRNSYDNSSFSRLNIWISKLFISNSNSQFNFFSVMGIKIQIFVAFAYTYHYLNWFSKTSIIKWNKGVSNTKAITILGFWLASIGLYLYNFKVGFIILGFLSLIHVFLEFPLNVASFKGILASLKSKTSN